MDFSLPRKFAREILKAPRARLFSAVRKYCRLKCINSALRDARDRERVIIRLSAGMPCSALGCAGGGFEALRYLAQKKPEENANVGATGNAAAEDLRSFGVEK